MNKTQTEQYQPFEIAYDENLVNVTAIENQIQAAERTQRIEQVKYTGRAVIEAVALRMSFAAVNLGNLVCDLASEARDEFGR